MRRCGYPFAGTTFLSAEVDLLTPRSWPVITGPETTQLLQLLNTLLDWHLTWPQQRVVYLLSVSYVSRAKNRPPLLHAAGARRKLLPAVSAPPQTLRLIFRCRLDVTREAGDCYSWCSCFAVSLLLPSLFSALTSHKLYCHAVQQKIPNKNFVEFGVISSAVHGWKCLFLEYDFRFFWT